MDYKILFVGDESLFDYFENLVKRNFGDSYYVETSGNYKEALEILEQRAEISLVVSDIQIPPNSPPVFQSDMSFLDECKLKYPNL